MIRNNEVVKLLNKYHEQRLSHAFLLETNDIESCINDVLNLIKNILCSEKYDETCESDCNICYQIEHKTLPSLVIVEPDGATIKKQQIVDLQNKFSHKPIYSNYNIYIIKNAEKLTLSSANSMLKFLEEPNGQVIGFFLTNNKENVLATIRSRCQIIKANYDSIKIDSEKHEEIYNTANEYMNLVETDLDIAFLNTKKIVLSNIKERSEIDIFFNIILNLYNEALQNKLSNQKLTADIPKLISNNNSISVIINKIKLINEIIRNLQYNPNLELILDKFIIEMRDIK